MQKHNKQADAESRRSDLNFNIQSPLLGLSASKGYKFEDIGVG